MKTTSFTLILIVHFFAWGNSICNAQSKNTNKAGNKNNSKEIFQVEWTNDKRTEINGQSSQIFYEKGLKFSLEAKIKWPKCSTYIDVIHTNPNPIPIGDKKLYAREPIKVCNDSTLYNDNNTYNLSWWIKHNRTTGKGTEKNVFFNGKNIEVFNSYVDYVIEGTLLMEDFVLNYKVGDEHPYFISFVKDGNIHRIHAKPLHKSASFFFTKQQLEEAGYDFNSTCELRYGNKTDNITVIKKFQIIVIN